MAGESFSIYAGDSRVLAVAVKDQAGSAVNLTGAYIKWVLVFNGTVSIERDNATLGGITITNAASGLCSIVLADTDTRNLVAGKYTHEARVTIGSNSSVVFKGEINVKGSSV